MKFIFAALLALHALAPASSIAAPPNFLLSFTDDHGSGDVPACHASAGRTPGADYHCHIKVGQVSVAPGDLGFGDRDGVGIAPRRREADVIAEALKKASGENRASKEIENGMARPAAMQKYGIL